MAENKIKFKISIKELSFEFEGSRDVGNAIQSGLNRSLGQILDTQRILTAAAPPVVEDKSLFDPLPIVTPPPAPATPAPERTSTRKSRRSGGPSLPEILKVMANETFFKEPRSLQSITDHIKVQKARNVKGSSLTGPLADLVQEKVLYRQLADGAYVYKDSEFNESARAPSEPEQASG